MDRLFDLLLVSDLKGIGKKTIHKKYLEAIRRSKDTEDLVSNYLPRIKVISKADINNSMERVKTSMEEIREASGVEVITYVNRESTEEHNRDDYDAGDLTTFQFWSLGNTYQRNWRNGLTIELLPQEASFLRNQVIVNQRNTLFAYVLKNNISLEKYESFGAFTADLDGSIGEELQNMIKLANDFNNLASLITTRYNLIVSCGRNQRAIDRWDKFSKDLERRSSVNLLEIYHRLGIRSSGTKTFLLKIQDAFNKRNIDKADEMIIARESNIKRPSRAKTNHAGEYPEQQWIGAFMYDYRFTPTKRIVADIMNAEVLSDV